MFHRKRLLTAGDSPLAKSPSRCFFFSVDSRHSVVKSGSSPEVRRDRRAGFLKSEYSSAEDAKRSARGYTGELFGWRNAWDGRHLGHAVSDAPRQNLHNPPNEVIRAGLTNLDARNVAGLGDFARRQFNVGQIKLAVNVRRHALEARFPHQRIILRRAFDKRRGRAAFPRAQFFARNLLLNGHQPVWAIRNRFWVDFFVEPVTVRVVHI